MNSVRIEPWDGDADVAAEAFTRGFSQSSTPLPETAERIRHQMRIGHADPEASLVAWDGDRPVGSLLATFRSDGRAWVQKMAVAPEYRSAVLRGTVVPRRGLSPYTRVGNWAVGCLALGACAAAWYRGRSRAH